VFRHGLFIFFVLYRVFSKRDADVFFEEMDYSRTTAAALLAVSAGACVGLALSPAVSSLYAPVATPVASQTSVSASTPLLRMRIPPAQAALEQYAAVDAPASPPSMVNSWTVLAGSAGAVAAALVTYFLKGSSHSSEQIAVLAAAGKKAPAKKSGERQLWYPTATAPDWLDGSLPGDRGFDPWGLSKPTEYLQFDLDGLDQNKAKNPIGGIVGKIKATPDVVEPGSLAPYSEVFGLQRFRECELIHGRWAMLAVLGVLVGEAVTGVAWQDAGLYEATNGATYWGNPLPFTGTQITWFEVLTVGFVEIQRNTELNVEKRSYPGGAFDPLGLTSKDAETTFSLKEAELKHGRLAMLAFLGFAAASGRTGLGATEAFNAWAAGFN